MAAVTAHSAVFVAAADSFALPSKKKTPRVGSRKHRAACRLSALTRSHAHGARLLLPAKYPKSDVGLGEICARGAGSRDARDRTVWLLSFPRARKGFGTVLILQPPR